MMVLGSKFRVAFGPVDGRLYIDQPTANNGRVIEDTLSYMPNMAY
jgi:hypothetical protein